MTRDRLMRIRQRAIEALDDPSEAVRQSAQTLLLVMPALQEKPHEERLRNE